MKHRRGSSTVLIILIAVMLATIAILSLSTSFSGYRLSMRLAERTRATYRLDAIADRSVAGFAQVLAEEASGKGITPAMHAAAMPEIVNLEVGEHTIAYDVIDVESGRGIHIELDVRDPRAPRVVAWVEISEDFVLVEPEFGEVEHDADD